MAGPVAFNLVRVSLKLAPNGAAGSVSVSEPGFWPLFDVAAWSHDMTAPVPAVYAMTPAFEVEFVDGVDVADDSPPGALWSTRFECVNHVRWLRPHRRIGPVSCQPGAVPRL
jgi:hypothetical protein